MSEAMTLGVLDQFHPAIREWFRRRFPGGPTEAQARGWESIASGRDTLVAAPTGSGKTLAGFLVAIDRCLRSSDGSSDEPGGCEVVYVSPLKALTVDIRENLEGPLREINEVARELGLPARPVAVAVRNGDTPASARAAMLRHPPQILVTTPESLYLLVTSARGREMLATTKTVIVDEIHALARDKRGSHLALTLERLHQLCLTPPVRIGLSATQRPIETVARLLVGSGPDREAADGSPICSIVDTGHRRALDVAIELPDDELGAVATIEQLDQVIEVIAGHVRNHRTTLVFVNTRRMSERVAHLLAEKIGDDTVAAHHGSLSTDRRLRVEGRLREGTLKALVATASLELGIDVGPVDLVCQLGTPRSIATFLQRVGRAEHRLSGVPKGRLFPLTRDELVECAALLAAVRAGELDRVHPPVAPLDILAQQVVAEAAAAADSGWPEDELYQLVRRASPYAALQREAFDEILSLSSEGVLTGRGRRGAHLHRDRVNGVVRARRGARIAALTSGGAIPEVADYRVVLEPDDTFIGTVNEDWAIESMAGDVFLLGSTSWRIRRVETGTVRVVDAAGAPPTIPFWLGEAPARTDELADAVSSLRADLDGVLASDGTTAERLSRAATLVGEVAGVGPDVTAQVVSYLAAGRAALGILPTKTDLVFERFFDDTGGMQLVLHSPYGGRVNRGLGLALRKRFCRSFDFELQAAASDDAVVLSLGPQHSFPMEDLRHFLNAHTVEEVLTQALVATPMFAARWRWNLTRSLIAPRWRGGRRVPPAIQRMESDDLMAAVFPALAACQENTTGAIEIPDHPIVRQTLADCMTEAIDLEGIERILTGIASGEIRVHFRELVEPSLLAHEILNGRPYTFLDDAPLEERRTRAVQLRRGIPLEEQLGAIDPEALAQVRADARPTPRDSEELHELIESTVLHPPRPELQGLFAALVATRRAMMVVPTAGCLDDEARWCATEGRRDVEALWPDAVFSPDVPALDKVGLPEVDVDPATSAVRALRGHLEVLGPVSLAELDRMLAVGEPALASAAAQLEADGFLIRGHFDSPLDAAEGPEQVCARRILARAHALTRDRRRRSVCPVSAQSFVRFLLAWQHVAPGTAAHGPGGLTEVIEQLQGFEMPVGAFEESVLPARVSGYHGGLLDQLCQGGEVAWGRLSGRDLEDAEAEEGATHRSGSTPSRSTPVTFVRREDLPWLLAGSRGRRVPAVPTVGATAEILDALETRGALFFADLCTITRRLAPDVAAALWDGVARGLVTADEFRAVRTLLGGHARRLGGAVVAGTGQGAVTPRRRPGVPRRVVRPALSGGRWSLLVPPASANCGEAGPGLTTGGVDPATGMDADELAEATAGQLLLRWGVLFRDLLTREQVTVPWRDLLFAMRRLEGRGVIRGGRFVTGFSGEQFALPEAVEQLRRIDASPPDGAVVTLSAADPLNQVGIIVPGPRLPAVRSRRLTLVDGLPVEEEPRPGRRRVSASSPPAGR